MAAAPRKSVLIVDDCFELIQFVRDTLEPRGFEVLQATNPFAAVREATARPPDVIVLDLNMPGMDGLEVMHHLRRIPETREIPIIAFTGERLTEMDYARGRGFDRIVLKESGLEALEHEIAGMIAMC
jgi:two-component system, cell cycle response regulator DivK